MKQIADGCYQLKLGAVNAYLIESGEGLALVDTGFPDSEGRILSAIAELGHQPSGLKHIVLTHAHPDHVGSAAALVRATGAATYMHEADIAVASGRKPVCPIHAFTGLWSRIMYAVIQRSGPAIWTPVEIDIGLQDGDVLPFGDIRVIHTPGHCAEHVALLWPDRSLLFAADACVHYLTLRRPAVGENEAVAMESLRRLASERFDVAAFGHGRVIKAGADRQFRRLVENG